MEKFKAKQLRRLKTQKDGWEKAFQLISEKYKPNQTVEDIQRLLKDCGNGTANFTDRPIDAATTDELNVISEKYSIECKAQGKTTRHYYTLAKERLEQVSKEYDEFEINYKKRQKKRRGISLLVAGVIVVLTCSFIYLDGPKYLQAEKYMNEEKYEEALDLYSQCKNNVDAKQKAEEAKYQIAEAYMQDKNYETALEWYSQCEDYLDAKEKGAEAEYQIAEAYMRDRNYEAALERYSQCENYLDVKEKEAEARYQIAEAYIQDEKYSDAVEWYTQCGDYRDAENKAEEAKRKQDEVILQSLGLEADSRKDIYTLGNEIPCGLVKRAVLFDDFLNITNNYRDKTEYTLTYGDYSLYGYSCEIVYRFNKDKRLSKIEVVGPYVKQQVTFTSEDIKRIGNEIQAKLNVEPDINDGAEGIQYTFTKDGIVYQMDNSGRTSNRFRLTITAQ